MSLSVPPGGGPSIENPEVSLPFTFDESNNNVQLVEQGTDLELAYRVWICLSYEPGMFWPNPNFGMPNPAFKKGGADLAFIDKTIRKWVPDADDIIERNPNWFESLVDQIQIRRKLGGPGISPSEPDAFE